ncbi:uncharacterized protein LOC111625655 [Centruroides sculpturatus]|uniref:uncharacterized protein LOC111625655 n=1 Tax=Centruroides sculpturatus TaxID=218467 RepID=UPI000C6D5411|nr:uncharacterized protein LOC111625655 [Centruroides sculpturatus]
MNKVLFFNAFLGIILSYTVDGNVLRKRENYEVKKFFLNPFKIIVNLNKVIEAVSSLESHLEESSPDRELVAEDINSIIEVLDTLKGTIFEQVATKLEDTLSELKSAVEDPSNQDFLDSCRIILEALKPILNFMKGLSG